MCIRDYKLEFFIVIELAWYSNFDNAIEFQRYCQIMRMYYLPTEIAKGCFPYYKILKVYAIKTMGIYNFDICCFV